MRGVPDELLGPDTEAAAMTTGGCEAVRKLGRRGRCLRLVSEAGPFLGVREDLRPLLPGWWKSDYRLRPSRLSSARKLSARSESCQLRQRMRAAEPH